MTRIDDGSSNPVATPDGLGDGSEAPAEEGDEPSSGDGADAPAADDSAAGDGAPPDAEGPGAAPGAEDTAAERTTEDRGTEDGAGDEGEHPLEQIVIESADVDPEAAPVLDEPAALTCANAEFAMDALIEASPDRAERFGAAAEWAAQSNHLPIRVFADRLAANPDGAEAEDLVVEVLEACAAGGYEL